MTGYTEILNTQIDVDSPVTTGLLVQLRDNPIAITEGATGAPKNQTNSIQDLAITEPKLANNAVTNIKLAGEVPVARAWINTSSSTINASFNVASISYSSLPGFNSSTLTVNLTTPMSNSNYVIVATGSNFGGSGASSVSVSFNILSSSSFTVSSNSSSSNFFTDFSVVVFGDQ